MTRIIIPANPGFKAIACAHYSDGPQYDELDVVAWRIDDVGPTEPVTISGAFDSDWGKHSRGDSDMVWDCAVVSPDGSVRHCDDETFDCVASFKAAMLATWKERHPGKLAWEEQQTAGLLSC